MDNENECKHSRILKLFHDNIKTDRDYWLWTELFVYLHDGSDYCNCNKNKNAMKNKRLQRLLFDTIFALVTWTIGTICAILIIKSIALWG